MKKRDKIVFNEIKVEAVPFANEKNKNMEATTGYVRFEKDGEYLFSIDDENMKVLKFLKKHIDKMIKENPSIKNQEQE